MSIAHRIADAHLMGETPMWAAIPRHRPSISSSAPNGAFRRYEFDDGSAIIESDCGWDFGFHRDRINEADADLEFAWATGADAYRLEK